MAQQILTPAVVRARHRAVRAPEVLAARTAEQAGRKPPTVEEEDRLLSPFEAFRKDPGGAGGEEDPPVISLARVLLSQIDDFDRRARLLTRPFRQEEARQAAFAGGALLLHRGRRRAEDECGSLLVRPHARYGARVVARRLALLVGGIVRFVEDDEAELRERREHRRARAHHRVHVSAARALPFSGPLAVGQAAVEERDPVAEARHEPPHERRCERDLGHEEDPTPARLPGGLQRGEVHLGLAASGDAIEEELLRASRADAPGDRVDRGALRRRRDEPEVRGGAADVPRGYRPKARGNTRRRARERSRGAPG